MLALVDALPFLHLGLLEAWLSIAAECVASVEDPALRAPVRKRLWEVLESGELDVERSTMAVSWWYARGGREMVLGLDRVVESEIVMSGALVEGGREGQARL